MHDLQALLASQEPKNIAPYIAKLQSGHRYHYGTTAEVVGGYVQRTSGLWVPSGAKTDSGPLDLLRTYITLRQISGGQHIGIEYVKHVLRGVPLREGLQVVASCMRVINAPGDGSQSQLDRDSLDFFAEPYRSRLEHLIRAGSVIHAPQLLMILAKLILGFSVSIHGLVV